MNKKTWIIFAAVVVVVLGGLILLAKAGTTKVDVSNVDAWKIQSASKASGNIADHVYGDANSKVILMEYGDFQCPYCGETYPGLKAISNDYKDQIAFVFRNFPLTTLHVNARAAAAAAEAAGQLGGNDAYWKMHDALYDNQATWENMSGSDLTDTFTDYAHSIGLDETKFKAQLANNTTNINQKISFDQALGNKVGVDSTPSIYLNGTKLSDTIFEDLEQDNLGPLEDAINAALKENHITPPTITNNPTTTNTSATTGTSSETTTSSN